MSVIVFNKKKNIKRLEEVPEEIILSNRLFVPEHMVTGKILDEFTYRLGDPCKDCDCMEPLECPAANMQELQMWREFKAGDYYGFGRGDIGKLKRLFDWDKVVDKRARPKMKYPLKFVGKLRPKQEKLAKRWFKKKYGTFKAPPRFGKTVMAAYFTARLGYQTLILVDESHLATQFYQTFMNLKKDDEGNLIKFTNAPQLEKKYDTTIVGIAQNIKDIEKRWPVTIMTYQKFLRHMGKLKKAKNYWGYVVVDECHGASAPKWSKILTILNAKIKSGCSATPDREDGLHVIAENTLGPVTAKGKTTQLPVRVKFINTNHVVKSFSLWTTFERRLAEDEERNELIVENIEADADAGRHILVTTKLKKHVKKIARMLRDRGYKVAEIDGSVRGQKRTDIYEEFENNKDIQIIVAIRRITEKGLDLKHLDCIHLILPNLQAPKIEQETARTRTPFEEWRPFGKNDRPGKTKPNALVRVYIDGKGERIGYSIKAKMSKAFKNLGFIFDKDKFARSKKVRKKKTAWG